MEIYQLENFVNIIELKSFSKAAGKMHVTQPTVTNSIKRLEEELETTLINRRSRDISTTDSGDILYKYAKEILHLRNRAVNDIGLFEGKSEGSLSIAASSIPSQYILPKVLRRFQQEHPGIHYSIDYKDSKQVIKSLLAGEINCGLVGARYDGDMLEYRDFCEDRLVLAVPNNEEYPWPNDSRVPIEFILDRRLIIREEGSGSRLILEKALGKQGLNFLDMPMISTIGSNEAIKQMVSEGMGISFISELAIRNELVLKQIKLYHVDGLELYRKFYFVYHRNRHISPLTEELKGYLLDMEF